MRTGKIKWVVSDIDGVLTDGRILLDEAGNEQKTIFVRDLDSIAAGRSHGLDLVFVTGEDNQLARTIARRFQVCELIAGAKDKLCALQDFCRRKDLTAENICFIGDSDRDAPAIAWAGLGVAPADGSDAARQAAEYVTRCAGGRGVLAETVAMIGLNRE